VLDFRCPRLVRAERSISFTVRVKTPRAQKKPFVSCPLAWPELENVTAQTDPARLHIIASEALHRVEQHGDLFAELLVKKQKLPHL
jgi:bifunctional non-homologous end joining protein LigD